MASEWPVQPLHTVARELTVGHVGTMADQYVSSGVLFLRSLNVRPFGFDLSDVKYVSEDFHGKIRKSALHEGDVVIVRTGRPGTCAVMPAGWGAVNCSDLVIVRCGPELRPHFLCYWVNAMAGHHVSAHAVGAVQQHFNVGSAKLIELPVPSLKDQDLVLSILRSLDDRIENLRHTNITIEAIAQALFKSWFVNFDPVCAKAEGREPEGMDAATAALFPSEFEGSELGPIPKGWRVSSLDRYIDAERGLSYKGAGLASVGEGMPMHNLNSVLEGGGYKYTGIKYYTGEYKTRHLVNPGDIIVANTEQGHHHRLIGCPAIVPQRYPSGLFSHHLYKVFPKPGNSQLTPDWLYWCLRAPAVREQIIGCANGSTVNMLKPAGLQIPKLVVPPAELCATFTALAEPLRLKHEANVESSETLASLRDTLLPRLISGKLRLPDAEAAIGNAIA